MFINFLNAIGHSGKVGVPHHFRVIIQGEFSEVRIATCPLLPTLKPPLLSHCFAKGTYGYFSANTEYKPFLFIRSLRHAGSDGPTCLQKCLKSPSAATDYTRCPNYPKKTREKFYACCLSAL